MQIVSGSVSSRKVNENNAPGSRNALARRVYRELDERDLLHFAEEAAARHHTTLDDLLGRVRHKETAAARRDLVVALYRVLGCAGSVGRILRRDRKTVMGHLERERVPVEERPRVGRPRKVAA